MLKRRLLILSFLALQACVTNDINPELKQSFEKTYTAKYEDVWRAIQQSIMSYPLRVNNMDTGQVHTTTVRGRLAFKSPQIEGRTPGGGYSYKVYFSVIREAKNKTRVIITKRAEKKKDFFSAAEEKGTDGLEEQTLLYRIGRELLIERMLVKRSKGSKKTPNNF